MTPQTVRTAWARALNRSSRLWSVLPLVGALALFGLPLFVGLDHWDLDNDEAIYSYSVDRILETGDWLTLSCTFNDGPFLEKPPLKTWIVAAGISLGLPHDETGLRFFDALFGLLAFGYVFVIGRRLSGTLCGFIALLVLHTCWPLMFEHGLRTNNMEAALVLTYCGGVYHFARWRDAHTSRQHRLHAWMVALWFAFGFLTKFVAALFLPLILIAAFVWQDDRRLRLRAGWRSWLLPAVAGVAVVTPWFVYQSVVRGHLFWNTILGVHVFQRFTSNIFPTHVQPWHFYFTRAFASAGRPVFPLLASGVGLLLLVRLAWQGRPWLARLVLVWWLVPFVLLSLGTSKLFHYAYPFLPPVALAAGLTVAVWVDESGAWIRRRTETSAARVTFTARPAWQQALLVLACLSLVLGVWSALVGSVTVSALGAQMFRSSGLARPALVAVLLCALARETRAALWLAVTLVVLFVAPASDYFLVQAQLATTNRPLRAIRDCVRSTVGEGEGVYAPDEAVILHPHYYYFRTLGPWATGPANREQELAPRLFTPGRQTPVLMSTRDTVPPPSLRSGGGLSGPGSAAPDSGRRDGLTGIRTIGDIVVWLPGPYAVCAAPALAAGGRLADVHQTPGRNTPAFVPLR